MESNSDETKRKLLVIMVDSGASYYIRRKSIRSSWLQYLTSDESPLTQEEKDSVEVKFVIGKKPGVNIDQEIETHKDIVVVDVEDSYDTLAVKTLEFMRITVEKYGEKGFDYFMHADDDSFIRLDLLLAVLRQKPKENYCYGYMWNTGLRLTKPLRNPTAKSYMPYEQYPEDKAYPPFPCGCGFALTNDLIVYLAKNKDSFKFYRLVDVAFGMYLEPINKQITFENDERIRPYRHLPIFNKDTIIQHYIRPEEFRGFWMKAIGKEPHDENQAIPESFYETMAAMGLMKR